MDERQPANPHGYLRHRVARLGRGRWWRALLAPVRRGRRVRVPLHDSPGITGEIDVRGTLDRLPPSAVPVGSRSVRRTRGRSRPVGRRPAAGRIHVVDSRDRRACSDGTWTAHIEAKASGDYRAVSGPDVSETRRLLVSVWKVGLRRTRTGVDVTVTPSIPYARFLVELRLRERFGWWPAASGKLDYVSSAAVRVKRRPARVTSFSSTRTAGRARDQPYRHPPLAPQEQRGHEPVAGIRLDQAFLPTKNGPSRSRWSDVCFVFRMRWTMIESGCSSGPRRPTTKSLSSRSRP